MTDIRNDIPRRSTEQAEEMRDENQRRLLDNVLWAITAAMLLGGIPLLFYSTTGADIQQQLLSGVATTVTTIALLILKDQLPYQIRAGILLVMLLGVSIGFFWSDGFLGQGRLTLIMIVLLSTILFGSRGGYVAMGISLVVHVFPYSGLISLDAAELLPIAAGTEWIRLTMQYVTLSLAFTLMVVLLLRNAYDVLKRQQALVNQLSVNRSTLQDRVEARTRRLTLTIEINRIISTILNREQLISEVVERIRLVFNYYHVHIYLLDDSEQNLIMVGGTGETGTALRVGRHRMNIRRGIVGQAAMLHQSILVPDVSRNKNWVANPLLPETKAEIAVPIEEGNELLGVLDVQHNKVNGLTKNDLDLLEAIAQQLGQALRNASLYDNLQGRLQREAKLNEAGRQIQQAADIRAALQTAAREVGEALKAGRTNITLETGRLQSAVSQPMEQKEETAA